MDTQSRNAAFYIKRTVGCLILLCLSAVFLFSAYSKLMSIEPFEWTFIDIGAPGITSAAILARVFIGLEALIGFFLLFHIYLKAATYPITIGMLVLLTIYLVLLIAKQGNSGNCGCFGNWIYMSPMQAIWKNLAMIAATVLLIFIYPVKPYKGQEWIAACIGMAALVLPMVLNPLNIDNLPKKVNRPIAMELLYTGEKQPYVDLRKGKHIVAFMSLTCPHCKKAAYFLQIIKRKHRDIPIFMVLSGHPSQKKAFFEETHAEGVPHLLTDDTAAFGELAGEYVPAIYWINNSQVERESNYYQLDPAAMKQWLNN